jgi:rod shape-determining protein MreD
MKVALRFALVLASTAVLQWGVFSQLRIEGAAADLFLVLAVTAGMAGGPDRGAIVGFFAGLTLDLLSQTPLGLSALVYGAVGYLSGRAEGLVLRSNRLLPPLLAAGMCALGVIVYALGAWVLGRARVLDAHLPVIVAVVAGFALILSPIYLRVMRWVWHDEHELRPVMR